MNSRVIQLRLQSHMAKQLVHILGILAVLLGMPPSRQTATQNETLDVKVVLPVCRVAIGLLGPNKR